MKRVTKKNLRWPVEFYTYFGCADEVYPAIVAKRDLDVETTAADFMVGTPGCTFADLEREFVEAAHRWAEQNGAPWPPYLPWAEEYANDLHTKGVR